MSIGFMSAEEIKSSIEEKRFSAVEIVTKHYDNIKSKDIEINAFLTLCEESAIKQAKGIDFKVKEGKPLGKLAGVPIAIKDNICTRY